MTGRGVRAPVHHPAAAPAYARGVLTPDPDVPADFARALDSLRRPRLRPEVRLTEVPAPARIAPFAVALAADVQGTGQDEDEPASGRFVLLHDPAGQEPWEGTFRVVTLVRAALDPETAGDPLVCAAAWSWVTEALEETGAPHRALGGTVTRVVSQSFGALAERPSEVEVEIRASWSPVEPEASDHLAAWAAVLCTAAGLPPLPPGVSPFTPRR